MPESVIRPDVQLLDCRATVLGSWWPKNRFRAPYWRLYWNPGRGAAISYGGRRVSLEQDRMVLIPPETQFTASCTGRPAHLYLHFLASSPYGDVAPGLYGFAADGQLRNCLTMVLANSRQNGDMRQRLMLALGLVHLSLAMVPPGAIRQASADPRIARAMEAIEKSIAAPPANAQLAQLLGMSTNAFIRFFHAKVGLSPQQYSTRKRIEHSCMQLHYSDMKLDRIAEACGFCDRYHFTRTFKRLRGIGPATFRRQLRGD